MGSLFVDVYLCVRAIFKCERRPKNMRLRPPSTPVFFFMLLRVRPPPHLTHNNKQLALSTSLINSQHSSSNLSLTTYYPAMNETIFYNDQAALLLGKGDYDLASAYLRRGLISLRSAVSEEIRDEELRSTSSSTSAEARQRDDGEEQQEANNMPEELSQSEQALQYLDSGEELVDSDAGGSSSSSSASTAINEEAEQQRQQPQHDRSAISTRSRANATSSIASDKRVLFFYRKPAFARDAEGEELDCTNMTAILLYNMALLHNLRGLDNDNDPKALKAALQLYKTAFALQVREGMCLSMNHALGLVNNCGQIQRLLNHQQIADRLFQHLLSTLVTMVAAGEGETVDDIEDFIGSTSHLIFSEPAAAAAA